MSNQFKNDLIAVDQRIKNVSETGIRLISWLSFVILLSVIGHNKNSLSHQHAIFFLLIALTSTYICAFEILRFSILICSLFAKALPSKWTCFLKNKYLQPMGNSKKKINTSPKKSKERILFVLISTTIILPITFLIYFYFAPHYFTPAFKSLIKDIITTVYCQSPTK